jgi:hypothetical protein
MKKAFDTNHDSFFLDNKNAPLVIFQIIFISKRAASWNDFDLLLKSRSYNDFNDVSVTPLGRIENADVRD